MKSFKCILFIIFFTGLFVAEDAYGTPPKTTLFKGKGKTSCTMSNSKFTRNDLVEYRFGVVAGQNSSTIKSKQSNSIQDVITGFMGGAAAQIIWPKGFILQPEILYSQKGCIFPGNELKYYIDYLEIPVKAMYRIQITDIKPFAFVSPYFAYAIKMDGKGKLYSDDILSDQINKFDFGFGAGAGFDVWKIQLSFKYSWGIAQVLDEVFSVRNNTFTVAAGIFF